MFLLLLLQPFFGGALPFTAHTVLGVFPPPQTANDSCPKARVTCVIVWDAFASWYQKSLRSFNLRCPASDSRHRFR